MNCTILKSQHFFTQDGSIKKGYLPENSYKTLVQNINEIFSRCREQLSIDYPTKITWFSLEKNIREKITIQYETDSTQKRIMFYESSSYSLEEKKLRYVLYETFIINQESTKFFKMYFILDKLFSIKDDWKSENLTFTENYLPIFMVNNISIFEENENSDFGIQSTIIREDKENYWIKLKKAPLSGHDELKFNDFIEISISKSDFSHEIFKEIKIKKTDEDMVLEKSSRQFLIIEKNTFLVYS